MRRCGFTLIEMLVVVGILAVLTALLFPVLGTVRENGRRAACQSNLHQIGLAMQQYLQDNDHRYPPTNIEFPNPYPLLAYVRDGGVFLCPDIGEAQRQRMGQNGGVSLSYEYDYPHLIARSTPAASWNGISDAEITHPAALWLYQDSTQLFWRKLLAPCGHPVIGSTLHAGGGNSLFVDGHTRWLRPEDFAAIACTNGPLPTPFRVEGGSP